MSKISIPADLFQFNVPFAVTGFGAGQDHVPIRDEDYAFAPELTSAILAGFQYNRRVLVQGLHGTGKSTHIEQVASRLNWPTLRINLDSQLTRLDLVGRDVIKVVDGKQVTVFQEGLLPWAMQQGMALILDEYDAARADVLFILQQMLEGGGKLVLLEENRVIEPHPDFRLFATSNTLGQGDSTGLYHGTQLLNQGQLDRWHIVATSNYLSSEVETAILQQKTAHHNVPVSDLEKMVQVAGLIRNSFAMQDISIVMSPRNVLAWAENTAILQDIDLAFRLSFLNRLDEPEKPVVAEFYQRVMGRDLPESWLSALSA